MVGALGSFLSGTLGYGLCRAVGRPATVRLLGEPELAKGERLFARVGGWLVVLSRWLPIFPEVIACMAGLTRMPARIFFLALACGSAPPLLAITLSALVPPLLWLLVQPWFRAKQGTGV